MKLEFRGHTKMPVYVMEDGNITVPPKTLPVMSAFLTMLEKLRDLAAQMGPAQQPTPAIKRKWEKAVQEYETAMRQALTSQETEAN